MPSPTSFGYTKHLNDQLNPLTDINSLTGGRVRPLTAGATVKIGDAVYYSASGGVVNISATASNYKHFAGFVVGGASIRDGLPIADTANVLGSTAATVGQQVWVQYDGLVLGISDATISAPKEVIPDASAAGRVDNVVATAGTTQYILGICILDSTQNNYILLDIRFKTLTIET